MKTTELIALLLAGEVTDPEAAYNIIAGDIELAGASLESPDAQALIRYFGYKITDVLMPVIAALRAQAAEQ